MILKKTSLLFLCCLSLMCFFSACNAAPDKLDKTPVIYSTDLFHPPGDMDDQVDLAALYGLPHADIKLVILDHGKSQLERPGKINVSQMNRLTGQSVRAEIGLTVNLVDQKDKALAQPPQFQAAVEALAETMKLSSRKLVIVSVGSLRDIAAAYNRFPELFREKVDKILIFAGEASNKDFIETNVKMDRQAFAAIMNSGLPIYWIPCFDGGLWQNNGKASYWQTTYGKILQDVSDPMLQYFLYATNRSQDEPFVILEKKVNEKEKNNLFKAARNLWSCPLLYLATGKTIIKTEQGYDIVPETTADPDKLLFDFIPVYLEVSSNGEIQYLNIGEGHKIMRFRIRNNADYKTIMTSVANDLIISSGTGQ